MKELNEKKVALTVGLFVGGLHILWSGFVLIGFAQPVLDFVFWVHMIANPYTVTAFGLTQALTLITVTTSIGYIGGWIFAWFWNQIHR